MKKRYAEHDALPAEAVAHAGEHPSHEVTMACARCGCRATGHAEAKLTAVYGALVDLEAMPCALVEIDANGYPQPVIDDVVREAQGVLIAA